MMEIEIEIKKYSVGYFAGGKNSGGYPYKAIIALRRDDLSLIGAAYFHRSSATLPNSDSQNASGYISCHYMTEDFAPILDLLRNERPVFLNFAAGSWNMANISTSVEPIGEGEPT